MIFISYRHEGPDPPTTALARRLRAALTPATEVWDADLFMDDHDLEPAELFDPKILQALDRTTHFIVLLTNSYWGSEYCRKELNRVIDRFERDRSVRLLFVKVDELDPNYFMFNKDRTAGRLQSVHPVIDKIGDVQFLGPFDEQLRLVRLKWEQPGVLVDQIGQLVKRVERVVER
jgi:hypothetical protein